MPRKSSAIETIGKEPPERKRRIAQRDEALAYISRRKHPELIAKDAGRSAVIRHRYNGRDLERASLQSGKQRVVTGTAAYGYYLFPSHDCSVARSSVSKKNTYGFFRPSYGRF